MKNWKEDLFDRLPFYWDGENVENFLSVIASELAESEESIDDILHTRRLSEITDGENIANGINLDKLARNVGQIRDKVKFIDDKFDINVEDENDEMFRTRTQWNVDVQQSDGITRHIKDLIARGLVMYRVRTGLGGIVYGGKFEADSFLDENPPRFIIPDEVDITDVRYIEPSDIYIFENYITGLEMKATDTYHGKYGNLTNFYQIKLPWKALPWSNQQNSLIWKSQDEFDRPFYTTFNGEDLSSGTLSLEHDLELNYPVISIIDDNDEYIEPDSVSVGGGTVSIDLDSYDVEKDWAVRITGTGFKREFTDSDLDTDDILTVDHNLDSVYPSVAIYDSDGNMKEPDQVSYPSNNTVNVDLTSMSVSGEWVVSLIGGDETVDYTTEFSQSDLGAREMEVIHGLGSDTPEVLLVDSDGNEYDSATVKQFNDDSILITFPSSSTVTNTWTLKVLSARADLPKDDKHGWSESVWTGKEEDLHIEPVKKLVELTRPAATEVELCGYGGMIWQSQDEFDDPKNPPEDKHHGWGARWDGDVSETDWAMDNLDDFWVDY